MQSKKSYLSIDEYIKKFSPEVQKILQKIREIIKTVIPEGIETIKYQIPTVVWNQKNLIHFGAFKHHIGLYPTPSCIKKYEKELAPYKKTKGAIQFPMENVPFPLIKKIISFRKQSIIAAQKETSLKKKIS